MWWPFSKRKEVVNNKEFQIETVIDGIKLDFHLTMDHVGNFVSAIPVLYDLPEAAQKLVLGNLNKEQRALFSRKLKAYTLLVRYLLILEYRNLLTRKNESHEEILLYLKSISYTCLLYTSDAADD